MYCSLLVDPNKYHMGLCEESQPSRMGKTSMLHITSTLHIAHKLFNYIFSCLPILKARLTSAIDHFHFGFRSGRAVLKIQNAFKQLLLMWHGTCR